MLICLIHICAAILAWRVTNYEQISWLIVNTDNTDAVCICGIIALASTHIQGDKVLFVRCTQYINRCISDLWQIQTCRCSQVLSLLVKVMVVFLGGQVFAICFIFEPVESTSALEDSSQLTHLKCELFPFNSATFSGNLDLVLKIEPLTLRNICDCRSRF